MLRKEIMTREDQLYLEFGKVWSNENGDFFRKAMTLLSDCPEMPVQDIVQQMVKERTAAARLSSLQKAGGGFVMTQGFSGGISPNPMMPNGKN